MDKIVRFFEQLRNDSGLQGHLLSEIAWHAPEILAEVAASHGYEFPAEDLRQILRDRELRSLEGEVFWAQICGNISVRAIGEAFAKISGPSWVKQAPYRRASTSEPEAVAPSLQGLYSDIQATDHKE